MRKVNYPITSFEMRNFHLTHKSTEVRIHRNSAHFISAVVRYTEKNGIPQFVKREEKGFI